MPKLPREVCFQIIEDVAGLAQAPAENPGEVGVKLSPVSIVSREWMREVEKHSFKEISKLVKESPKHFVQTFAEMLNKPSRQQNLRSLKVTLSFETVEPQGHHQHFFQLISSLFHQLKSWEQNFDAHSMKNKKLELSIGFHSVTTAMPLLAELYPSLTPLEVASLPQMPRVTIFNSTNMGCSYMDPMTRIQIACLMPNLTSLVITLCDPGEGRPATRTEHRQALIDGLELIQTKLPNLTTLKLINNEFGPQNHNFDSLSLLNHNRVDEFCTAVRRFTQNGPLQHLVLKGFRISKDLFADQSLPANQVDTNTWPNLQSFHISCGILSAAGNWIYSGDRQSVDPFWYGNLEDSDKTETRVLDLALATQQHPLQVVYMRENFPRHQWRTQPNSAFVDPLATEVASAVRRMPNLQNGYFVIRANGETSARIRLLCAEQGCPLKRLPYKSCAPTEPAFLNSVEPEAPAEASHDVESRRWLVTTDEDVNWEVPFAARSYMAEWAGPNNVQVEKLTDVCEPEYDRENWQWKF